MEGIDPAETYVYYFSPVGSEMIVSMSDYNYLSTDNGSTWQQFLADYSYLLYYDALRVGNSILLGVGSGVVIPNDELANATDVSWSNDGFLAWYRIGMYSEDDRIYANGAYTTTTEWVARSTDNGIEWGYMNLDPSLTMSAAPWIELNGTVYAGGRNENNGRAAIITAAGADGEWLITSTLPRAGFVSAFDVRGDSILAAITADNGTGYLYFSTNNGTTWKLLNTTSETYRIVKFLGRNMYVTDLYWHPYLSFNGGLTWDDPFSNSPRLFFTTAVITGDGFALAIGNKIDYDNEVIAPEIYRSTDDGVTWKLEKQGIPSGAVLDNATIDKAFGVVYISTDPERWVYSTNPPSSSVYVSSDKGISWNKFDSDLPQASRLFVGNEFVFAQGDQGLYRAPKVFSSVDDEYASNDAQPEINIYPNPTFGSTTITFRLQKSDQIRIAIYDLLGNEVSELVSAHYPAGTYELRWEAPNMTPGAYTIRIVTSNGSASAAILKF
jgi:hypothetical protein